MTEVSIICPMPLVVKVVKRAKELCGIEECWPYGDPHRRQPVERCCLKFTFLDTDKGNILYHEASAWVVQWERENEPE